MGSDNTKLLERNAHDMTNIVIEMVYNIDDRTSVFGQLGKDCEERMGHARTKMLDRNSYDMTNIVI